MTSRVKKNVSWQEFVTAWQNSNSVKEVAELLGAKPASIRTRATQYRKRGVQLKKMPRVKQVHHKYNKLDITAVNSYVEFLNTKQNNQQTVTQE